MRKESKLPKVQVPGRSWLVATCVCLVVRQRATNLSSTELNIRYFWSTRIHKRRSRKGGKESGTRKTTVGSREEIMNTPVLKKPVPQLGSMSFSLD